MTSVSDPVPITRSLDSIMKSLRGTDRIQIGGVFGRWDDAVGPAVAAHVRPVRLDQGVLTVEADEPALHAAARHFKAPLRLFTATELSQERYRLKQPSDYVEEAVGTPSVAEAAALKAGPLVVEKLKSANPIEKLRGATNSKRCHGCERDVALDALSAQTGRERPEGL